VCQKAPKRPQNTPKMVIFEEKQGHQEVAKHAKNDHFDDYFSRSFHWSFWRFGERGFGDLWICYSIILFS